MQLGRFGIISSLVCVLGACAPAPKPIGFAKEPKSNGPGSDRPSLPGSDKGNSPNDPASQPNSGTGNNSGSDGKTPVPPKEDPRKDDGKAKPRVPDFSLFKFSDDEKKKILEESERAKRNGNLDEVVKSDKLMKSISSIKYEVSKWTQETKMFPSKESKIYPGTDPEPALSQHVNFNRNVVLYLPPDFKAGEELPFMVVGDGSWSQHLGLMGPTLTNLILQKRIPRMAAVFIDAGPGDSTGSQRGLEYDMVTERYTLFVEQEILPVLEKDFKVKFTKDPKGRGAMGGSSSGNMAFTMAWFHPELYTRVLTYSGTFTERRASPNFPRGAWDYHQKAIPESPMKPIRVALHVSDEDNNFGSTNNWIAANENMAKALNSKGYAYRFFKATNHAKHIDREIYEATLAETLEWLWLDYAIR